jgi:hypothetical protein
MARASSWWARTLAVAAVAGVFLAIAGAFGSEGAPMIWRLAYWVGLMAAGTGVAVPLYFGLRRLMPHRPWAGFWLGILVMSALYTGIVVWATHLLAGGRSDFDRMSLPMALVSAFPYVFLISVMMGTLNLLVHRPFRQTHAAAPGDPAPRFLDRLPLKLHGAELYAVQAEDHYLRLHTSRGSDLILMRLSDAIAELEGLEGAQTHRSWWVAKGAVADVRRADGRATLKLKDGAEVPVSRTYARLLRQADWW